MRTYYSTHPVRIANLPQGAILDIFDFKRMPELDDGTTITTAVLYDRALSPIEMRDSGLFQIFDDGFQPFDAYYWAVMCFESNDFMEEATEEQRKKIRWLATTGATLAELASCIWMFSPEYTQGEIKCRIIRFWNDFMEVIVQPMEKD